MNEEIVTPVLICAILFLGLPWLFLHYNLQAKRARGLSVEDEKLLDDLHETARRLDERLCSIERIMTAENPRWRELNCAPEPQSFSRSH